MSTPAAARWKAEIWIAVGIAVLASLAVAAASGAQSFGHMYDWARLNHEPHWRSVLFPVSIDGTIVAATVVLYVDNRLDRDPHKLAYALLTFGAIVSVLANVLHDMQGWVAAKTISGIGPLALLGVAHLLMQLIRSLVSVWSSPAAVRSRARAAAPVPEKVEDEGKTKTTEKKSEPKPKSAPAKSGPESGPVIDDLLMQKARHLWDERGGVSRDTLKAELEIGTGKATALLAVLKKEVA